MALDAAKLRAYAIPDTEMRLSRRDTMLYALGVGVGADATDPSQLRFVTEKELLALPTMATIIAAPHAWIRKADVGSSGKSVHAGISFQLDRPLPVEGEFVARSRVSEIVDKGAGKAALVTTDREIFDRASGERVGSIRSTSMLRGDGGFGGESESKLPFYEAPDSAPDVVADMSTLPQAALIYRLSGDYNPLHSDPEAAKRAGFPRPILHGLCTYGVTGHALLRECCGYDPGHLRSMSARFARPVYPGETLRVEIWRREDGVHFRTSVPSRDNEIVLNSGFAEVA